MKKKIHTSQCTFDDNDNVTSYSLYHLRVANCYNRHTREEMKANLRNALSNNYKFISVAIFFSI